MQAVPILIPAPEGGFTVFDLETGTAIQGETIEEAITNLREAVALYLEEFPSDFADLPLVQRPR